MKQIKKLPKLHMNQSMFFIAYTKSFEVKPNSIVTLTPNLTKSFSTLPFFLWDTSVCKHRTWHIVQNLLIFLPQPPRMISWDLDKSHDFQTSFAFFYNLKAKRPHVRGHVSWTRCSKFLFVPQVRPHTRLNNMDIIFLLILFYYLNHLRFKFDLYKKNSLKCNKLIKYSKQIQKYIKS